MRPTVREARERHVARGVSMPSLVVARARGALIWDVDGREYLDFAGGLGCQNLGHNEPAVVAAIHEQVDAYLHQCFMVGMYEPYVEMCRRLNELSPCRGETQRSVLFNSGAEAVENAVKIARAATGRPAVVVFDNAFHGRTLLDDDDDLEGRPVQARLRPVRAGGLPHAGAVSVPRRHRGRRDRGARAALQGRRRSRVGRVRRARAGAGRGRLRADDAGLPARGCRSCSTRTGSSTSTTRCSPAAAAPGRPGRSSTTASSPTCSSPASRSAAGCRSRRHRPRRGDGRRRARRARRDLRRQPRRLRRGERRARHARRRAAASARGDRRRACARRSSAMAPAGSEVRGLGPMLGLELPRADAAIARRPSSGRRARRPAAPDVRPRTAT